MTQDLQPEASESRFPQYHQLFEQASGSNRSQAQVAREQMVRQLNGEIYYDPHIDLLLFGLRKIVTASDEPTAQRFSEALNDTFTETGDYITRSGPRTLQLNPKVIDKVRRIKDNFEKLQVRGRHTLLGRYCAAIIHQVPAILQKSQEPHNPTFQIMFLPEGLSARDKNKAYAQIQEWEVWSRRVMALSQGVYDEDTNWDTLIDQAYNEPRLEVFRLTPFHLRQYGRISLHDIEQFSEVNDEEYDLMTEYVTQILTRSPDAAGRYIARILFTFPKYFQQPQGSVRFRHEILLKNLNLWQQQFLWNVVFPQEGDREEQTKALIRVFSPDIGRLGLDLYQWCSTANQLLPGKTSKNILGVVHEFPFLNLVLTEYEKAHSTEKGMMVYADEIGYEYFLNTILPQFRERLKLFGVPVNVDDVLARIQKEIAENPFPQNHLESIKEAFETSSGEAFQTLLSSDAAQIDEKTEAVWQSTVGNVHYLPMEMGVNIFDFSSESVPSLVGLSSIIINRSGGVQDWSLNIAFTMKDTPLSIMGRFTRDGQLTYRAGFAESLPQLHSLLRHIATLYIHDLVKESSPVASGKKGAKKAAGPPVRTVSWIGGSPIVSHRDVAPRRRSDRELIESVSHITDTKPRLIEVHPHKLSYAEQYRAAVNLYNEAVRDKRTPQDLAYLREEVIKTRKAMHKISKDKLQSIPALMENKVEAIRDPLVLETAIVYNRAVDYHDQKGIVLDRRRRWQAVQTAHQQLQLILEQQAIPLIEVDMGKSVNPESLSKVQLDTWVIEHSNPKPEQEDLASQAFFWERHYKRGSAVDSLNTLLPWFVGQKG